MSPEEFQKFNNDIAQACFEMAERKMAFTPPNERIVILMNVAAFLVQGAAYHTVNTFNKVEPYKEDNTPKLETIDVFRKLAESYQHYPDFQKMSEVISDVLNTQIEKGELSV